MLLRDRQLPAIVIEQHKRMGFSVKSTACPRYGFYINTRPGAGKDSHHGDISIYKDTLTSLSRKSPEGDDKESILDYISDPEKACFDGQKVTHDSTDRVELHVPYQLVLALEMAKQKAYGQVIQTDFKQENVLIYLVIVKNLEKAKFFYKGLGYLDLGPTTAYISSEMYEITRRLVKEKQPFECKFPKSSHLDIMRWALVTDGIRCPQLEYNQPGGYVSVMPKESVEKLLGVPGIGALYDKHRCENESITAKEFMMRIKVSLSEQDETPTKQGRLAVLETFVILLERIYGDTSPGSDLAQISQEIQDQKSAMSKFLLPPPKLFSLFKEPNDSYDAAISFLVLRIKEVKAMQTSLKTQMPELDKIENGSSTHSI